MQQFVSVRNRARFQSPGPPGPIVARDRLDGLYADATGCILRVLAPPGYGKSTQVARWVAAESRQVGWIDVERIDNDPLVFASALARALSTTEGDDPPPMVAFDGPMPLNQITATMSALAASEDHPYVLVLDDVHNIDSEASAAVLESLLDHLPRSSTVVLCGRSHSDRGSLARHRLVPGVVDVTAGHLALDATETDELLRSMGVHLELEALSEVCDRFEGWAAGLRLAGLALRTANGGDRAWLLPDQVGDATYVVDYLRSEWTGQLAPDHRAFLGEVACLNRFTGTMCDEILGRTHSLSTLRRMHREELLVLPLDQRDEWFRMHPLLTRWLSADLAENDPARWQAIHRAAAAWWTEQGDIDLAVEHATTIGDLSLAADLVTEHGYTYSTKGLMSTVRRWLDLFPSEFVAMSPGLSVITALDAVQRGDGPRALHWYGHLARLLEALEPSAVDPRLRQRAEMLRIILVRAPSNELLPVAEALVSEVAAERWDTLVHFATGGLRFLAGDDRAPETLDHAAFLAGLHEMWVHQANCRSARGILADLADDRATATEAGREAAELLTRWPSDLPPTTAITDALIALNAARAGQRELAMRYVEDGRRKLVAFNTVAPWFNALCGLALTRAALLVDDRTTSRTLLRELEHALRLEAADNGATVHVNALRASIDAARQLPSDPAWALTESELNVLQYLPTNLTLADIATRLFVSRNTVKSHVAAIYRKLDATSRRQAVDSARSTGLLDDGAADGHD